MRPLHFKTWGGSAFASPGRWEWRTVRLVLLAPAGKPSQPGRLRGRRPGFDTRPALLLSRTTNKETKEVA